VQFNTFRKSIPNNSLTWRIAHGPDNPPFQYPMGLETRFFSPSPKLTRYTGTKMDMDMGSGTVMKIQRIAQWCVNTHGCFDWMTEMMVRMMDE
jgi:hypothetical protein